MTPFKTQTQCMNGHFRWVLCAEDKGWGVVLPHNTICFHHPCVIPCYPYTDSNMTCHSEREQCHWGLLQACPLCNFSREHYSTMAALRICTLGSMRPGCKPIALTLAHPQPETPSFTWRTHSTHSHCFTIFVLLTYWLLILIVVVVTVVFFFHFPFCSAAMTSAFPCTTPQTRPTKRALTKGYDSD